MKVQTMQKSYDLSRLVNVAVGEAFSVAANTQKTVQGVCSAAMNVMVKTVGNDAVLFHSVPQGRFKFDIRHNTDLVFFLEPALEGSEIDISMLEIATKTVRKGDPERSFTSVDHRPAINPALDAVLREMKLMQGEMRSLRMQARQPRAAAAAPAPARAQETAPAPARAQETAPAPARAQDTAPAATGDAT